MFFIEIIAILILILFLPKHSLCPRILEHGLLLFQDKENVLHRNPYSDIISTKHSLCPRILEQGLLLFQDKENVLHSNPYSDIISIQNIVLEYYYSRTKRMFCIEIIAILILILVLSKHSLCPRILEQGLLLFQDKENVLYRNNSNPYSDIISIQTFSLSWNTRTGIYSRTKRTFCIEIIAILILILVLSNILFVLEY